MNDFIFGTLATDELRLALTRNRLAGVTHIQRRNPRDPLPGEAITLELSVGPGQPGDSAWVYWTSDGSDPLGSLGQAQVGQVAQMELTGESWEMLLWGYVRHYAVTLPGLPDGSVLRYRLSAAGVSGQEVWADQGAYFACYIANDPPPPWTRQSVIYQIFVDRFNPGSGHPWLAPETPAGFYGGRIQGITEKLDYIAALGANVLWLTPVFPSPSHHGYDATDLFEIEPRLGKKADLRRLLDAAHQRGMRVLLDFVPNHWSHLHATFQDAIHNPSSPYRDWYTFKHWPDDYESFFGVKELPQVNLRNPAARQSMLDAAAYWLDFGVDGYRLARSYPLLVCVHVIIGLPGDDLGGFMRSVDFVADHGLQEDVQIFPLSVLPGTAFRRRRRQLGLCFEPHPPYTVTATSLFAPEDFLLAYDYAESRLDTVFFPLPDLELSWRKGATRDFQKTADLWVRLGETLYLAKLILNRERPLEEIRRLASRLTQPYQVVVGPRAGAPGYLERVLRMTTAENPFTPFEVVFLEPPDIPRTSDLLGALNLRRPHFLDGDLRYLFPQPGNRAVLFSLVSEDRRPRFRQEMQRQVYWWRNSRLPSLEDLSEFADLDGVVIDSPLPIRALRCWQDEHGSAADEYHIGFADVELQARWLLRTNPDDCVPGVMNWRRA